MKVAKANAYAKTILIGEHSVVYGSPAISMIFKGLRVEIIIEEIKNDEILIESMYYNGPLNKGPSQLENIIEVVDEFCIEKNLDKKDFKIKIESEIPAEKGIGSSAAVSVALTKALYKYIDENLTKEELYRWSCMSEEIVHGKPSGIDSTTIIEEETIFYRKNDGFEILDVNPEGYLIVADSGDKGSTKQSLIDVEMLLDSDEKYREIIKSLSDLTYEARIALERNDLKELGKIMTKGHYDLKDLTLSNDKLDNMVDIAIKSGALGAKLTGGGRGGCMIALCDDLEVAQLVKESLEDVSEGVWISYMGEFDGKGKM